MSRESEAEARRLENERVTNRCKAIGELFETVHDNMPTGDAFGEALTAIADLLLAEATYISEQRRKGSVTASKEYTTAGRILQSWAAELTEHSKVDTAYHRPPLPPEHRPSQFVYQPPAGDIDARLDAAFGPAPEPVRHIAIAGVVGQTWCGGTDGTRTFRLGADCRLCIKRWETAHPDLTTVHGVIVHNEQTGESVELTASAGGPIVVEWNERGEANVTIEPETAMFSEPAPTFEIHGEHGPELVDLPPGSVVLPTFSEPAEPVGVHGQKRMTFAEVREHGMARARGADHRSYSQVQAFKQCGIRYALSDLDAQPSWWNVGGTALHYAVERINRTAHRAGYTESGEWPAVETLWSVSFGRAVSEAVAESGVTPDRFRSAKGGKEGYDWWRVEGPLMVGRWVARLRALYDDGWRIATIDSRPAVEISLPMFIPLKPDAPGGLSDIKVENIIDLVMVRGDTFMIIDMKSGASAPDATYQLGQYGWALTRAIDQDPRIQATFRVVGAYWLARVDQMAFAGNPIETTDLRELHPWDEVEYITTTMHQAESQGLYLPNKNKSDRFGCGSCGVRGLCPVGPS